MSGYIVGTCAFRRVAFDVLRAGLIWRTLLAACFCALLALPDWAHAQATDTTYVSNQAESTATPLNISSNPFAQTFVTGSQAGGYALDSVNVTFRIDSGGTVSAAIYSTTGDPLIPDAEVFSLTAPATFSSSSEVPHTFTAAANTTLDPNTTYAVVLRSTAGATTVIARTDSDNESEALAGWSIGDVYHQGSGVDSWRASSTDRSLLIAVRGPTTNTPATGAPAITGTAQVGGTLTATPGTIDDADGLANPGYTYQWQRVDSDGVSNPESIADATAATYTVIGADVGRLLRVAVSFQDDLDNAEGALFSTVTAVVTCESDAVWCATLTVQAVGGGDRGCANSHASNKCSNSARLSDDTFTYDTTDYDIRQLRRQDNGDLRLTLTPDITADSQSLILHVGDAEFAFAAADTSQADRRVWSSAGLSWSNGDSVEVKLTGATATTNTPASGAPEIAGAPLNDDGNRKPQHGLTLMADTAGISDADGLAAPGYTYQWIRVDGSNEDDIPGATGATYTVTGADVGMKLKLKVDFTDDGGAAETLTSMATASVVAQSVISFDSSTASTTEGNLGGVLLNLRLSSQARGSGAVQILSEGQNGATPADYRTNTSVQFNPGDISRTFEVAALDDDDDDDGESVKVSLGTLPPWMTAGADVEATVTLIDTDASDDATLGALTVNDGTNDHTIDLALPSPSLDVANAVTTVTLTPTPTDEGATVAYLDESAVAIPDADTNTAGHQVALGVGATVINVVVTAESGNATQSYELTVTRAAAVTPTAPVLVSNIGQADDGFARVGNLDGFQFQLAQKFTTGSHPGDYTLNEVSINLPAVGADAVPVITIRAADSSGDSPVDAALYTLTALETVAAGDITFGAPAGAMLGQRHRLFRGDGERQHHRQQRGALCRRGNFGCCRRRRRACGLDHRGRGQTETQHGLD